MLRTVVQVISPQACSRFSGMGEGRQQLCRSGRRMQATAAEVYDSLGASNAGGREPLGEWGKAGRFMVGMKKNV